MRQRNHQKRQRRVLRGLTYMEVLVAAMILVMAGTGAISTVMIARKSTVDKRLTEMGIYCAYSSAERIRAEKFVNIPEITAAAPNYLYYDLHGVLISSYENTPNGMRYYDINHNILVIQVPPTGVSFTVTWSMVTTDTNGDGVLNANDMRTLTVKCWNPALTTLYESLQLNMALGGV